jgi:hypothetical protein
MEVFVRFFPKKWFTSSLPLNPFSLGCSTIGEKLDTFSELIQDLQLKPLFGVRRGLFEGKTVIVGIWLDSFQRSDFLPKPESLLRICC